MDGLGELGTGQTVRRRPWVQPFGCKVGAGILKVAHISPTFPVDSCEIPSTGTPGRFHLPGCEHSHSSALLLMRQVSLGVLRGTPGLGGPSNPDCLHTGLSTKTLGAKVLYAAS